MLLFLALLFAVSVTCPYKCELAKRSRIVMAVQKNFKWMACFNGQ